MNVVYRTRNILVRNYLAERYYEAKSCKRACDQFIRRILCSWADKMKYIKNVKTFTLAQFTKSPRYTPVGTMCMPSNFGPIWICFKSLRSVNHRIQEYTDLCSLPSFQQCGFQAKRKNKLEIFTCGVFPKPLTIASSEISSSIARRTVTRLAL